MGNAELESNFELRDIFPDGIPNVKSKSPYKKDWYIEKKAQATRFIDEQRKEKLSSRSIHERLIGIVDMFDTLFHEAPRTASDPFYEFVYRVEVKLGEDGYEFGLGENHTRITNRDDLPFPSKIYSIPDHATRLLESASA